MKRLLVLTVCSAALAAGSIDRYELVNRHNVHIDSIDAFTPLSLGNGAFCFTADVTGLQSFPDSYAEGIPLTTMSQWGWHSFPNTQGYELADTMEQVDTYGREVSYNRGQRSAAGSFLRANPHQISLALIGLELTKQDGSLAAAEDITDIDQTLNLWKGILTSRFKIEGVPVYVQSCAAPSTDTISARIESPLIKAGRLKVRLRFPYAAGSWGSDPADWQSPEKHNTLSTLAESGRAEFVRVMDEKRYFCYAVFSADAGIKQRSKHEYCFAPVNDGFEISVSFSEKQSATAAGSFSETAIRSEDSWRDFWTSGAAIDLSLSKDPRWEELERRIVLSRYLTAIQSRQEYPPQETGLTCNSWFGKFHLEMHWWHSVHFALWNMPETLEKSLGWYADTIETARAIALRQGYKGVRWAKMTSPSGEDSPSGIGPMLIWQQPHPIYYAELIYRANPRRETLEKYREVVLQSAEFMADFAHYDAETKRYILGPPVIPAQENYSHTDTFNPTFELCYWQWGLMTAQKWRERLGLEREKKWQLVIEGLSILPIKDGIYCAVEPAPYTNLSDHPSMLDAFGFLPETPLMDVDVMRDTAQWVYTNWNWPDTWGWDYPTLAMTAARTGLPELAVDALFIDSVKNTYLANGHNYQRSNLPLYLPGNGGLLTAVAMMAGGWDGAPDVNAPGFPQDGSWTVRSENLAPMP
ncbi:MAG: hypothetical protein AB7F23_00085 [Phycisphaerae bacterium]